MAFDNSSAANAQLPIVNLVRAQQVAHPDNSGFFGPDFLYLFSQAVTDMRNYWAADIVMLIRETTYSPQKCGEAYSPGFANAPLPGCEFEQSALGVTVRECGFAEYPFQHEFAHIFGANHDLFESNPDPLQDWAYAKVAQLDKSESARTLVSNSPNCGPICTEVLNYSNSLVSVGGFNTGTFNLRENARVIAEVAPATARYRTSVGRIFADGFE